MSELNPIFRHFRGDLYRVLFEVGDSRESDRVPGCAPFMEARVATNDDPEPYRRINIHNSGGRIWALLPYRSVAYISQKTLEISIRKYEEFYGDVKVMRSVGGGCHGYEDEEQIVKRFQLVTS
jgi:hypothetical protein